MDKDNTYVSLDEARAELVKRWNNAELRKRVEAELEEKLMPSFGDKPRGYLLFNTII